MDALAEGSASEKEISRLLDEYLAAKKVAKLYVAEEKFRRQHIRNFKGGHKGPGGAGQPAQGGNGSGRPAQGQGGGKPGARR